MRRLPRQRGFTLLEVMVAALIMALAVGGLMAAIQTSIRNAARLTDHDRMSLLARSKMDELLAAPNLPLEGHVEGRFDPSQSGGEEAGFTADISVFEAPPNVGAGTSVLDRIVLNIWWNPGEQHKTMAIEAFRRARVPQTAP